MRRLDMPDNMPGHAQLSTILVTRRADLEVQLSFFFLIFIATTCFVVHESWPELLDYYLHKYRYRSSLLVKLLQITIH